MGAYSELDLEQRYGDNPFAEDDPFVEDEPTGEAGLPAGDDPFAEDESNPADSHNPAGADAVSTVKDGEAQAAEVSAAQSQTGQTKDAEQTQTGTQPATDEVDEDATRKAHEESEAQRKAEWDAEKKKKKAAEKLLLAQIDNMSNDDVMAASLKRVSADTERLTRRNMKECVSEHIQTMCLADPDFARKVMHPRKSMIHCIWYINRKAREFVEQEMKDNGIKPENGVYGSDVPDDLCYQWAVDYFNDPNAQEDKEKAEKFVPKPFHGKPAAAPVSSKPKGDPKGSGKNAATPKKAEPTPPVTKKQDDDEQISFGGFAMPEEKAG